MVGGDPIYDPQLLDYLESKVREEWSGSAWRQVFEGTDPARANIGGSRWNPHGIEALYMSLSKEGAAAEIDHLVNMQPLPIQKRRLTYPAEVRLRRLVDLSEVEALERAGVTIEEVRANGVRECQMIGGGVAWLGFGGLLIPSARSSSTNLVIYLNSAHPDDSWEFGDAEGQET